MADISALIAASSLGEKPRGCKLIIAGSRDLSLIDDDITRGVEAMLDEFGLTVDEVVSGNARGPDRAGEQWAASMSEHTPGGIKLTRFPISPADWRAYGRFAGPRRNREMALYADALLAFWDGKSRGTKDMIEQMRAMGKPVRVVRCG